MVVDFEHQAKAVALARKFTLVLLCAIFRKSTFECNCDVRRQRTKKFDILRSELLARQLWCRQNAELFLKCRDGKKICAPSYDLGSKRGQIRMLQHFLRQVGYKDRLLLIKYFRDGTN